MPCKKDPSRIIYCGHFKFWKGIHLAMHAFALARKNNPNLHLLLVGKGNIRLWMNTFLKSNKLAESVKILDWLPQDKLQTELSKSGLLLLPSLRDSGGMVILEALASGTPVIALDKAGPGTILKNHRRFLIDTEKRSQNEIISSIADRIVQITSCEKNFTEASIAAIMCAEENSWKNRINEFIEQYVR
jgi:glycosyltransferase involved in cell wall biosynthesis